MYEKKAHNAAGGRGLFRSAGRRTRLILLVLACLLTGGLAGDSLAQGFSGQVNALLTLNADTESYDLSPYLYITRVPRIDETFSVEKYEEFVASHLGGQRRGEEMRGDILNMGAAGAPHWLIFEVTNESWNERWVLSFGSHMEGRVGQIRDLVVVEKNARVKLFDNTTNRQNPFVASKSINGTYLPLTLARGKKAVFVIFAKPEAGFPATASLSLMTEDAFARHTHALEMKTKGLEFFLIVVAGFFVGALIFKQMWSAGLFALYYVFQIALLNYGDNTLFPGSGFESKIPGLIFCAGVVTALFAARAFLDIDKLQQIQSHAIIGFILGISLSALAAASLSKDGIAQPLLMYAPALGGFFFIFLLSLAQAQNDRYAAYQFAFSWLVAFAGGFVTLLSLINVLPPGPLFISAYWWSLVPQGLLFCSAVTTKFYMQERELEAAKSAAAEDKKALEDLKQSKEAAENSRLMRLIEYERAVLNELREREAKQNEDMRAARDEADGANKAKSAFLAVVSHEIRTPMTGVMGMVRLLLDTSLSKDQKQYAQTILDSGDAMMALLNDILDFEKIESGKMELEHVDFDLLRVINSITTLMSGHADAKKIFLRANIDPSLPRYVIGDPVRLRQVLLNLTGNSIKFTAKGGVTLHVRKDPSGGSLEGKNVCRVRIAVEDTGIGISQEAQKSLFSPFSQAEKSTARKFGGTGLGLAISQKLIEAMGGRIEINSTEGQGSTFYFTLLMEEGSAAAAEDASASGISPSTPQKKMKILVVEDNEVSQKLLKEFIDRMGHDTALAGSGEEALKILETAAFDMILMDVELPGMTGMGTTKAIRAMNDRQKAVTPVIALTGNVRAEDIKTCYAANMNGHLPKPVDPKKLKNMIEKVITGKLDNPVAVEDRPQEKYTQITKVELPGASRPSAIPPQPPQQPSPPAVQEKPDSGTQETAAATSTAQTPPLSARRPETLSPVERFALGQNTAAQNTADQGAADQDAGQDFADIGADDLDEDSFETAMEAARAGGNAPAAAGTPVRDTTMMETLRGNVGKDMFARLISEMFERAENIIGSLQAAAAKNDITSIGLRAHELKGMAGNFGLPELSAIAAMLERAAKDKNPENIPALIGSLPQAYMKAKDETDAWINGS